MTWRSVALLALLAVTACGGDKPREEETAAAKAAANAMTPDAYRKRQQAFADSVLNSVAPARKIVEKLGKGYEIGSTRLRDSVAALAAKSECFEVGRKTDPYLAGTVSVWVNMGVIGSDVVSVQESQWTSPAGNLVDACMNQAAKRWKFDQTFGKPSAYIVQVQFK